MQTLLTIKRPLYGRPPIRYINARALQRSAYNILKCIVAFIGLDISNECLSVRTAVTIVRLRVNYIILQ